MPTKATLLKIDDEMTRKINIIMSKNGLKFATVCKSLIYERLAELFHDA